MHRATASARFILMLTAFAGMLVSEEQDRRLETCSDYRSPDGYHGFCRRIFFRLRQQSSFKADFGGASFDSRFSNDYKNQGTAYPYYKEIRILESKFSGAKLCS